MRMDQHARQIARAAAKTLEENGERDLRIRVEEALMAEDADQLALDVALASLIVSIASLAWTIAWNLYDDAQKRAKDRRDQQRDRLRAEILRSVRDELAHTSTAHHPSYERVAEAVVDAAMERLP